MPALTHLVSLEGPAGVELQFAEFVSRAATRHPGWRHTWLDPAGSMHPLVAKRARSALSGSASTKYLHGVKLPSAPVAVRAWHCRRRLAKWRTDVVLIWNRSARLEYLLEAAGPGRCMHYEHGAAWFGGREVERRDYFRRVPAAICNSRAAARVLEDVWRYEGATSVCLNALRPALAPRSAAAKAYPGGRSLRLGAAARLFPVKGLPVVLHALSALRARSIDAELYVAGEGPERAALEDLARVLGLSAAVRFLGRVERMDEFYGTIDLLVHAPLSEAFGLVAIESAAHGCPAIVAAVDGLPEAVAHGTSGLCVTPSLTLTDYAGLGGTTAGLPPFVFDPSADAVAAPRAVAPADLADAVESLVADPARFETLSRSSAEHVAGRFGFDRYVDELVRTIASFAADE